VYNIITYMEQRDLLTTSEVADLLGVSHAVVLAWRHRGTGVSIANGTDIPRVVAPSRLSTLNEVGERIATNRKSQRPHTNRGQRHKSPLSVATVPVN
jgi:hypothetical protein